MTQLTEANPKSAREAWIRALERTASIDRLGITLPALIGRLAEQFGEAPALIAKEGTLSYRGLAARSNQYARWGLASVLGDILSTGLGVLGLSWQSSPALSELEQVTCDWVRQMVGLSSAWRGVIQDTASTSTNPSKPSFNSGISFRLNPVIHLSVF